MKHLLLLPAAALLAALLWACSESRFEVDGEVAGLGTQNVHMVWLGDDGVVDDVVAASENKLAYSGSCSRLTVVSVFDAQGELLAQFAAQNGDHIQLKGDRNTHMPVEATGNDVNEAWTRFRTDHARLYDGRHAEQLNRAIEQWVQSHTADPLAALLLLFDHNALADGSQAARLLAAIPPEARPEHLTSSAQWLAEYYSQRGPTTLHSLTLCGTGGEFQTLAAGRRPALLCFWSKSHRNARRDDASAIKAWQQTAAGRDALVADVLLDADTAGWNAACRADSATTWRHYWAPGGPVDPALKGLRIASAPWYVATDSAGRITYNGNSLNEALKRL